MAVESVDSLVELLGDHRLLQAEQLEQLQRFLKARFTEPRGMAKQLIQWGWLTVFQTNLIFQGRVHDILRGPYRILDRLGEGGVSQVYKALDTRTNQLVALKVIRPEYLGNAEAMARFQREVHAATRLSHPNIVKAFAAAQLGQTYYLAMEYIEGTDLQKLVQLSGPLPIPSACRYIRQGALALQHAHEFGLVHRDVKPGNLLLAQNAELPEGGVIKLLDLGLARIRSAAAAAAGMQRTLTWKGSVIGTADYLAPEQAQDPRNADIRADIYSLGCTLYFLLAGHPPFPGGSGLQKIFRHGTEEPAPMEKLRPETPPELAAILRKTMAKNPAQRYQTPGAVAVVLAEFC